MVNDGLISALSRMENPASLPHGRPSNRHTRNVRQGSFEDMICGGKCRSWFARRLKRAAPLLVVPQVQQKLTFLPLV
jgi:hypothetical protein